MSETEQPGEEPDKRDPLKLVLAVLAFGAIGAMVFMGVHPAFSPENLRAAVAAAGVWGPIVFLLAFALLQPFGLSAHAFIIAASFIWPWPVALALSWTGAMLATTVSYWFARYVGRDWVQSRLPERVRKYDEQIATKGFRSVLMLRLVFFTFGPMQMMLGVSRARFVDVMTGTAVGVLPVMVAEILLGSKIFG